MTVEELQHEIIKLGDTPDISWHDYKERLSELITQFEKECINDFVEFCSDSDWDWWIENKAEEYLKPE